jgi:hypothetical protein
MYPDMKPFWAFSMSGPTNSTKNTGLGTVIGGFSMYGGDGQFIYNFNKVD